MRLRLSEAGASLIAWAARRVLNMLFIKAPKISETPQKEQEFEQLLRSAIERGPVGDIAYTCPYPKYEFLHYIVTHHPALLHGANASNLTMLEPHAQTNFNGQKVKAVFASGDAIWPIFYAIFNRRAYRGSIRNGCFVLDRLRLSEERYYFFSVNDTIPDTRLWTAGTVYILLKAPFTHTNQGIVRFDEWASPRRVYPLAQLRVTPEDFPLLSKVTRHKEGEAMIASWLSYRHRIRRQAHESGVKLNKA